MIKALDSCYKNAIEGIPGFETVEELGDSYLLKDGTLEDKIDSFISYQKYKCATSGFLTGLGGIITLPIAVPANVTSVLYIQLRMIAVIAYMSGFNVKDDRVQTLVYVALCGNAGAELLKNSGIKISERLSIELIKKIPAEVIKAINKAVGFRLVTKFGQKGLINLSKMAPLVGGLIGGAFDWTTTNTVGNRAKKMFFEKNLRE